MAWVEFDVRSRHSAVTTDDNSHSSQQRPQPRPTGPSPDDAGRFDPRPRDTSTPVRRLHMSKDDRCAARRRPPSDSPKTARTGPSHTALDPREDRSPPPDTRRSGDATRMSESHRYTSPVRIRRTRVARSTRLVTTSCRVVGNRICSKGKQLAGESNPSECLIRPKNIKIFKSLRINYTTSGRGQKMGPPRRRWPRD